MEQARPSEPVRFPVFEDNPSKGRKDLDALASAIRLVHDLARKSLIDASAVPSWISKLTRDADDIEAGLLSWALTNAKISHYFQPPSDEDLTATIKMGQHVLIQHLFRCLEKKRIQALTAAILPSPSEYAKSFMKYQSIPTMSVRNAPGGDTTISVDLMSLTLYTVSFLWHQCSQVVHNNFGNSLLRLYKEVATILDTEMAGDMSHELRVQRFAAALHKILPSNGKYQWYFNDPVVAGSQFKIDMVLRRKSDLYPMLFVEVKRHKGEGGNPFMQNSRYYREAFQPEGLEEVLKATGGVALFMQLDGQVLSLGGAFSDSQAEPHIAQNLCDYVEMSKGPNGMGYKNMVRVLWVMHEAFKILEIESDYHPDGSYDPIYWGRPRLGLKNYGITPTSILIPGRAYRASFQIPPNVDPTDVSGFIAFLEVRQTTECMLEIINPAAGERYGSHVQRVLSKEGFAPWFIQRLNYRHQFWVPPDLSNAVGSPTPLLAYIVTEFQPPPSPSVQGWMSLLQLATEQPVEAANARASIEASLDTLLAILDQQECIHGELIPANLFVQVKSTPEVHVLLRSDTQAQLRVVGYHLAAKKGKARFPNLIQEGLAYMKPGQEGQLIPDHHDRVTVDSWFPNWAQSQPSTKVYRGKIWDSNESD
ncbi:hypothetical protein CVT26_010437 [Gymnopilus dilepis]|uniref:Uncharacterized protein n=1 Tax=Gymnopilus dilepis TaxID=231916 RepID=A0A409Y0L5_9AGAR|nr:hypothetical protein CVT26_010437 [Gymnopilus dilepis]